MKGWNNGIKMDDNKRAISRTSRLTNYETSVLTYEQTQLHKFTWNDFPSFPGTFRQTQLMITCLVFGRLFSPRGVSTRFRVMASTCGASRSYSMDTPQSIGLFWTSDQPDRDLYLTLHNTQQRYMPTAGCEPVIPASERPQTYASRPRGHWNRLCSEDAWLKHSHSIYFGIQVHISSAAIAT